MSRRTLRSALAALAAALLPAAAHACAVCSVLGSERSRKAFFDTTIFLSLLPLALIGFGAWWLARRFGGRLAEEFREREDAAAEAAPRR